MKLKYMDIKTIREHEAIDIDHLNILIKKILKDQLFKEPIIVDEKSRVILDGHHRFNCCIKLGFKKIPCLLVDYLNDRTIRVFPRRKEISITKLGVIQMGLSGGVFPHKTTKHFIPHRVKNLKIPLKDLIC